MVHPKMKLFVALLLCVLQQAFADGELEIDECPILKELGMEKERFDDLKFLCMKTSGDSNVSPSKYCQKLDSLKKDIDDIEDPVARVVRVCGEQEKSFCWAACACVVGNEEVLERIQEEENGCESIIEFDESADWIYPIEKDFSERESAIRTLTCRYKYPIAVLEQLNTNSIHKLVQLKSRNQFSSVSQIGSSSEAEILQLLLDIDQVNLSIQPGADSSFLVRHKLRAGYAYTISRNWEGEKERDWGQAVVPRELKWVFKDELDTESDESDQELRSRLYEYVHGDYQSINELMRAYGHAGGWDELRQEKLIQTITQIMIELAQKRSVSLVNQEAESFSVPTAYRTKKRQSDIDYIQWRAITQSAIELVSPVSFWSTSFYFHVFSSGGTHRFIIQRPGAETSLGKPLDENEVEQEVLFSPMTRFKILKWRERRDGSNEDKIKEVVIREDLTVSSRKEYCSSADDVEPTVDSDYRIVKAAKTAVQKVFRGVQDLLTGGSVSPTVPTVPEVPTIPTATTNKEAQEEEEEAEMAADRQTTTTENAEVESRSLEELD